MARCQDCGKRLFPLFNTGICGPCADARHRAEQEERFRKACVRRDELNAHGLFGRAVRGAWRGALLFFGLALVLVFGTLFFVLALFSDRGAAPPIPEKRWQWMYLFWWALLSGVIVGGMYLVARDGVFPNPPLLRAAVPLVVLLIFGAQFGADRAARRDWGWWLDLEVPMHLRR